METNADHMSCEHMMDILEGEDNDDPGPPSPHDEEAENAFDNIITEVEERVRVQLYICGTFKDFKKLCSM